MKTSKKTKILFLTGVILPKAGTEAETATAADPVAVVAMNFLLE